MTPNPIQTIFDQWNVYKGQSVLKKGKVIKWRGHREIDIAIKQACRRRMGEGYTADEICKCIHNYARVLLDKDYIWSMAWTLPLFLTRSKPDDRSIPQIWRWLPNQFELEDFPAVKIKKNLVAVERGEVKTLGSEYKIWAEKNKDTLPTEEQLAGFRKQIKAIGPVRHEPKVAKLPVQEEFIEDPPEMIEEYRKKKQKMLDALTGDDRRKKD